MKKMVLFVLLAMLILGCTKKASDDGQKDIPVQEPSGVVTQENTVTGEATGFDVTDIDALDSELDLGTLDTLDQDFSDMQI